MRRRASRWIAVLVTFALLFSQGLVAAYACTIGSGGPAQVPGSARVAAHGSGAAHDAAHMPNCSGMVDQSPTPANLCEAHCLPAQPAQPLDAPTAAIAPQPALIVSVPVPLPMAARTSAESMSAVATPPPRLRFSRLLI